MKVFISIVAAVIIMLLGIMFIPEAVAYLALVWAGYSVYKAILKAITKEEKSYGFL